MSYSVYPLPSSGITVSDGNNAGWNLGANQWEQIAEYKSSSTVASIDFNSIPQTYRALRLQIIGLTVSTNDAPAIRINNDSTTSTYSRFLDKQVNNSWDSLNQHSQNRLQLAWNNVSAGNTFHAFVDFPNYTSSYTKEINWDCYYQSAVGPEHIKGQGSFRKGSTTPAITSLNILTFGTNMYFDGNAALAAVLWGIK